MTIEQLIIELLKIDDKNKIVELVCGCPGTIRGTEVEEILEEKDKVIIC